VDIIRVCISWLIYTSIIVSFMYLFANPLKTLDGWRDEAHKYKIHLTRFVFTEFVALRNTQHIVFDDGKKKYHLESFWMAIILFFSQANRNYCGYPFAINVMSDSYCAASTCRIRILCIFNTSGAEVFKVWSGNFKTSQPQYPLA